MEYGVTEKGFVMKRFDKIVSEVQADLSGALGFDVSQNPQSLLNAALVMPFCDKIAVLWEVAQDSYYAKYPSTAEGVNLDNACQYGNVFRRGNRHTEYTVHCTAKDGTVIPAGSLISSVTNPAVKLKCIEDTMVARGMCNSLSVRPVVAAAGTYTIELNGTFYSYEASAADTLEDIADGLLRAFRVEGYHAEKIVRDNGEIELVIADSVLSRSNDFALTNNLTTNYVTGCVHFYTVEYGDIRCPKGSITTLTSNVTGLISAVNLIDPVPGRIQQDDISLRQDYIRKTYSTSSTQTYSVESYILENIPGVKDVRCYENPYNVEDELGRPPHSIEVIVDGGEPERIAAAILDKKAGGITTYGDITVNVLGEYGDVIPISFRRPQPVYAYIKVEITQRGAVDPDYVQIVQNAICKDSEKLTIGDDFLEQTYLSRIYEDLAGTAYCDIKVAGTTVYDTEPDESAYARGNIYVTERQSVSIDAARIEVVLKT